MAVEGLKIYPMLLEGVRVLDETGQGLFEKLSDTLDDAWKQRIYDRCTELPTLMSVGDIDAKWIALLKPLLGFTDDLSFDATTEELRRILSNAIPYWNKKPSELGVIDIAISLVTGNRFRVANFFDFRMQTDKTVITEELEDFDPSVIGFPSTRFSSANIPTAYVNITSSNTFTIVVPDISIFAGATNTTFGFIAITADSVTPANVGVYKIASISVGANLDGVIVGSFAGTSMSVAQWILVGYAGEYTTEVRLVDQGAGSLNYRNLGAAFTIGARLIGQTSGAVAEIDTITAGAGGVGTLGLIKIIGRFTDNETINGTSGGTAVADGKLSGVVNRDLLDFLMGGKTSKPFSERINVVYINFLDQFLVPNDFDQWNKTAGILTSPANGGEAIFDEGTRVEDLDPYSAEWSDQVIAWKFYIEEDAAKIELTFMGTDDQNHYFVRIEWNPKQISLWKKVSNVDTQIGSTVSISYLKAGIQETVRVDALKEGSDTRIRVKLSGSLKLDEKDSPSAFTKGKVGAFAKAKLLHLELVEVNTLPTEIQRIGPNP